MLKVIFTCFIIALNLNVFGQDDEWHLYPESDGTELDSTQSDSLQTGKFVKSADTSNIFNPITLDFNKGGGSTAIEKDGRIDEITEFLSSTNASGDIEMDGYRVQIYFGPKKDPALGEKARFLAGHSADHRAYLDWDAPHYFVRVGDFRTKLQAEKCVFEIKDQFPDATVIRTKINAPKLD